MTTKHVYGVDLVTFYHPSFWGVETYDEIMELRQKKPETIWVKILDGLVEAGITAIEMTFPPADMASAIEVFGSAHEFKAELDQRGLVLKSGFHMATGWGPGADRKAEVAKAVEYANFIADAGGDVLVAGPPMRQSRNAVPPMFVDLSYVNAVADTAHAVGDATLRVGVKTALHTEAHSIFCTRRDVNLLLTLTDPEYIYFCPDTSHLTLAGGDPVEIVSDHLERVIIAHFKDAIGAMPSGLPIDLNTVHDEHQKYMCPLGDGVVDWPSWFTLYERSPGKSIRLLELDAVADPVKEMKAAKAFAESFTSSE